MEFENSWVSAMCVRLSGFWNVGGGFTMSGSNFKGSANRSMHAQTVSQINQFIFTCWIFSYVEYFQMLSSRYDSNQSINQCRLLLLQHNLFIVFRLVHYHLHVIPETSKFQNLGTLSGNIQRNLVNFYELCFEDVGQRLHTILTWKMKTHVYNGEQQILNKNYETI